MALPHFPFCFTKILGRFGGILVSGSMASLLLQRSSVGIYRKTDVFLSGRNACVLAQMQNISIRFSIFWSGPGCVCRLDLVWIVAGPGQLPDGIPESSDTVASGRKVRLPEIKPESFLISSL